MSRKLLQIGLLMTIVNVMGGGMGYLFQILMGRMLSPQEFALFSAIMSVATVMNSPINAVFTVISRNITQALVVDSAKFVRETYNKLGSVCLGVAVILLVFALLFGNDIGVYIKNSNGLQIALLAGIVSVTFMGQLNNAYLQGGQRYIWIAGSGLSTITLKILFSVGLVVLGFGVDGALVGVVCSTLLANIVIMGMIRRANPEPTQENTRGVKGSIFDLSTLLPVLVANVSIAVMTQLDVLLVNNFFSPEEAGKYAAAATLGKAVLYLPGGIVMALFPMVTEAQAKAAKVSNYILTASGMTFAMCMVVVIFYWFAGQEVIRLFFGEKYAGAEEILKYYSLAMLPMALLIVAEYFLMALGKAVYAWLSFIFAPAQILLIYFYHDNLLSVLTIVGVSGLLLLICGYLFLFKLIRSNSGQKVLI